MYKQAIDRLEGCYVPGLGIRPAIPSQYIQRGVGQSTRTAAQLPSKTTTPVLSRTSTSSTTGGFSDGSDRGTPLSSASSVSETPDDHLPTLNEQLAAMSMTHTDTIQLPCEFGFSGCNLVFHDYASWDDHTFSHFRHHAPPPVTVCTFCDHFRFDYLPDPGWNWAIRMSHIYQHYVDGDAHDNSRPDFRLLSYLNEKGLISPENYQHAIKYTERPYCPGLVADDFETPEMKNKREKALQAPHDLQKEKRHIKKESSRDKGKTRLYTSRHPRKHGCVQIEC